MSTAQWLYIALAAIYLVLFLVFCRIFYWKFYADTRYYKRRPVGLSQALITQLAQQRSQDIPRFSIFVPARNEADVIEKTIAHLSHLDYSPDHYEVLVVTDEKEAIAAREERATIVERLTPFLANEGAWEWGEQEHQVLIALLSRLALEEADLAEQKAGSYLSVHEMLSLSRHNRETILHEMALALSKPGRKVDRQKLERILSQRLPQLSSGELERLYPTFLSFAFPTVMLAAQLKKQSETSQIERLVSQVAQARQPVTQKVLTTLTETVSARMAKRLQDTSSDQLTEWVAAACIMALPTTQEIVERKRMEYAAESDLPALKHVEVPYDFDGYVGGVCTGEPVPSTKGRALNYAFGKADERNLVWGFYDAESRPDPEVLLYVAWRRLTVGDQFQIAQGPVYQIRNFWQTGPVTKIAGLYQAISHEWTIPWLLRKIPFIGGTNIFATRNLMLQIEGFDDTVLTEDMELGARAWLLGDAWPEFLPYASSEQTPPTVKAFYRQRLRWGSGYLQVYDKIKADPRLPRDKKDRLINTYFWMGPFSWVLFQLATFLPLIALILTGLHLMDATGAPIWLNTGLKAMGWFYLLFTFYIFFHYYRFMDKAPSSTQTLGFIELLALPISTLFLQIPYSAALVLKWQGKLPTGWVKTPRTKE